MTREWTVTRTPPNGQAVIGVFDLASGKPCASLERLAVMIPEGRYRLELTVSGRASLAAPTTCLMSAIDQSRPRS